MVVTINDFVRYRQLKKECTRLSRQISKLEESTGKRVKDKATGSMPEFPYTEIHIPIVGILNNTARINARKDRIAEIEKEMRDLAERLKGFLDVIPEDKNDIRDVLEFYYIDCVGSVEEAVEYAGLDVDANAQMQKIKRYMEDL